MKSLFTIHVGEYLVGSYIESEFKNINVWMPSKDTGIDFLLTNENNSKTVSIQVKFSKDFLSTNKNPSFQKGFAYCGFWNLNYEKIRDSKADFWVFVLNKSNIKDVQFIIIHKNALCQFYKRLGQTSKKLKSFIWITEQKKCWEGRGLSKQEVELVANNSYQSKIRDLTSYLNNWKPIEDILMV